MVYLHPPYHVLSGVTLMPDHRDPHQFYYLPARPRLVTQRSQGGVMVPLVQLVRYSGDAGSGGFLNLDVHLDVPSATLAEVRRELRRLEGLARDPRLAPVPVVDGNVTLMILGRSSDDAVGGEDRFVVRISHPAKPSLFGEHRATFSIELDDAGTAVLQAALRGERSPVAVVYELEFLALRPAFAVRVHADWERVQAHLERRFRAGFLFASGEITEAVAELVDERAIQIEADAFVDEDDVVTRRDDALRELRDIVLDGFFEPAAAPAEDDDRQDGGLGRLVRSVVDPLGGLHFVRRRSIDLREVERRNASATMRERTAVRRRIYPQGHVAGLAATLGHEAVDLGRFVVAVDLDHAFFQRRELHVRSNADFEGDGIEAIEVRLEYGAEPRDVVLDADATEGEVDWRSRFDERGAMEREVTAEYVVRFREAEGQRRPATLSSLRWSTQDRHLVVTPRELYGIAPVLVTVAPGFPWERYQAVEVECRSVTAGTPEEEPFQAELQRFVLDADRSEVLWRRFHRGSSPPGFEFRALLRAKGRPDRAIPWSAGEGDGIRIDDPYSERVVLTVAPTSALWSEVATAFVDLDYADVEHEVREQASLTFTADDAAPRDFVVHVPSGAERTVSYRVTLLRHDGSVREVPRSTTVERRLFLRPDMQGRRTVRFHLADGDPAAAGLRRVEVEVRHGDDGERIEQAFTLDARGSEAAFTYAFVEAGEDAYEYRLTYHLANGMTHASPWRSERVEALTVPLEREGGSKP